MTMPIEASFDAVSSTVATLVDAHPCRYLPATRCWATNFDFQNTTKSLEWHKTYLGPSNLATYNDVKVSKTAPERYWKA
jgi:hypothetical protein